MIYINSPDRILKKPEIIIPLSQISKYISRLPIKDINIYINIELGKIYREIEGKIAKGDKL